MLTGQHHVTVCQREKQVDGIDTKERFIFFEEMFLSDSV